MYKWMVIIVAALLLAACGDDENMNTQQADTILDEQTVSFELADDEVKEAKSVPKGDKDALFTAFNEYIDAFNAKDIERYMAMIAENPQGFDYEEDEQAAKDVFATYDVERQADDVTIVDYANDTAQIFANLTIDMQELTTGASLQSSGRQVTVFVKEHDAWKVTSVYFIGNETSHVGNLQ